LTVTPASVRPPADRAAQELGEGHRDERYEEEDRAAVDEDQQDEDEQPGGHEQRPVDALEDLYGVGAEAGSAGDLDLQAALVSAHAVANLLDGVADRVALAVGLDVGNDQLAGAVARDLRRAERRRVPQVQAVELGAIGGDARAILGREAAVAVVDDDDRRQLGALQLLGRLEGLGRLGVAGQERRRLILLVVGELAGHVGGHRAEDDHEPDAEHDPLGAAAGREGQELAHAVWGEGDDERSGSPDAMTAAASRP
jgi:hypothetical protein